MDGSIGWSTVIVQYDTTAHSTAIIAAAAMIFEGVLDYDMHSGKKIAKSVLASVVPVGSEAEARLLGEGKPLSQTLLIIREWGHVYTQGQPHAEHMAQIAQHARDGLRAATGQDVQLQGPASAQKPRSGKRVSTTSLFVWFIGRLHPPQDGRMFCGVGVLRDGGRSREVIRSPEPLSFVPAPGSRRHAALSMPGWRWDRTANRMRREEDISRGPSGKPSKPVSTEAEDWDRLFATLTTAQQERARELREHLRDPETRLAALTGSYSPLVGVAMPPSVRGARDAFTPSAPLAIPAGPFTPMRGERRRHRVPRWPSAYLRRRVRPCCPRRLSLWSRPRRRIHSCRMLT